MIAATRLKHYGYATFSQLFSSSMEKDKNLEEIYLAARKKDTTPGLSMISTAAGQEAHEFLLSFHTLDSGPDECPGW